MFEFLTMSAELMARIDAEFAPEDRREVRQLLRKYGRGPGEGNVEEVRRAILDYADGHLEAVEALVERAKEEPSVLFA